MWVQNIWFDTYKETQYLILYVKVNNCILATNRKVHKKIPGGLIGFISKSESRE